jgi:hypothetical protein
MNDTAIIDSGCTSNLLSATAPCMNKRGSYVPLHVNMPNGTYIQLSHTSELIISALSPQARWAHVLPGLVQNYLISVGQLCDIGCNVILMKDNVEVNKDGKFVISGIRDQQSRLWRVDSKEASKKKYNPACNHAHETRILKELINYLHATAFSPVKSTWIKGHKMGTSHLGQD